MNISPLIFSKQVNSINNTKNTSFRANLYAQKPDSFERTTQPNFTGKTNDYDNIVKSLTLTNDNALFSLNGQIAADGWAGKAADKISVLWNSKNRAHLVKADIDTQKAQVEELKNSIKTNTFKAKFKEIFDVEYNQTAINEYKERAEEFKLAVTTKCMADVTSEKLSKHLDAFKENKGVLKDKKEQKCYPVAVTGMNPLYIETTPKKEILNNFKNSLVDVLGSEERLNKLIEKNGLNLKKSTDEDKYKAYGIISDYLIETSKATAKKCSSGKDLETLDTEYEKAYQKAYGTKNNIQERVDKYNRSQEIGAAAVRGVVRSGMVAAIVATAGAGSVVGGLAVGSAATFGVKMAVEISDKMTNDISDANDLSSKNLKKMMRSAAISSADYIASRGIKKLIPDFATSSDALDVILNTGKNAVIDTTTGIIGEYYKQGQWNTSQIIPRLLISATFAHLGKDNPITDQLMRLTKGGLNQAMKKKHRDYDAVREFVQGTKIVLDENYAKDPSKYGEIKVLATKNPEMYEEYICALLEKHIEEKTSSKS